MKVFTAFFCTFAISFLLCESPVTEGKTLHFGACRLFVHFHDLKENFADIKHTIVSIPVLLSIRRVLRVEGPRNSKFGDSCCFLRHLLKFYVEKVFKQYPTVDGNIRTKTSSLANSFLSIKTELRKCHERNMCQCGEESRQKIEAILHAYKNMDVNAAATKAIGELDILLEWMEKYH
uniref:Interleukin family protein n=1 Tax=Latimeria chalumnae TaxID=7897 RepID=H3A3C0_LATCH